MTFIPLIKIFLAHSFCYIDEL